MRKNHKTSKVGLGLVVILALVIIAVFATSSPTAAQSGCDLPSADCRATARALNSGADNNDKATAVADRATRVSIRQTDVAHLTETAAAMPTDTPMPMRTPFSTATDMPTLTPMPSATQLTQVPERGIVAVTATSTVPLLSGAANVNIAQPTREDDPNYMRGVLPTVGFIGVMLIVVIVLLVADRLINRNRRNR